MLRSRFFNQKTTSRFIILIGILVWILVFCPNQASAQCTASGSVTSPILCNGGTASVTITAASGTAPYSFTFNGQTNTTGLFTGVLAGAAQPYSVTDALGCSPGTGSINVGQPTAITFGSSPAITPTCAGEDEGQIVISATGGTGTITFSISPVIGSQSPAGTFEDLTPQTYTITATDINGCTATTSVTVGTLPNSTITLTSAPGTPVQVKCANTSITNITFSVGGSGTGATISSGTFPAGVTGAYSAGVYTISGTPTVAGTYNYTIRTTGPCSQATVSGSLIINAKPNLVITNPTPVCAPSTISITGAAVTAGSTMASGLLSYYTDAACLNVLVNPGSIAISGTYYIKVTSPFSCIDIKPVVATINPIPTVTAITNQTFCNGASAPSTTIAGPVSGTTFTWANSNTLIGLAVNGTGNIPAFTATNTTSAPITATISITPSASGCTGAVSTFTITVNPTATVSPVSNQTFCSGVSVASTTLSGAVAGTTFNWTNSNSSIGLTESGTGNVPAFTATNATSAPITSTITITPAAYSCAGTISTYTITVNPTAAVTTSATKTICSGTGTGISLMANVPAAYTWTVGTITGGVTGASAGTGSSLDQILTNPATTTGTVEYIVIPVSVTGSCTGLPFTITVTVNKAPEVTLQPLDFQDVCEDSYVDFTATASGVPTPAVQWQLSTNGGSTWTNLTNSGTAVTGATSNLLAIFATAATNNNLYRAVFTNSCGTATSTASKLSVSKGVFINVDPIQSGGNCVGGPITLTAKANSHKDITGQWQYFDGSTWINIGPQFGPANGVLTMDYTFTPNASQNGTLFRASMNGNCGGQISTAMALSLISIVTTTNACLGQGSVTFTNTGTSGGTWTVSGGGTITNTGVFTPSAPGCFTATYTTPAPFCTDTKSFIVFPSAPAIPALANSCNAPLNGISAVDPISGFTAEYAVQAPGSVMSAYMSIVAANALLTNTPGCWTIKARYKLSSNCGLNLANATSVDVSCQESTITAVVFPAAPAITAPANTCSSAFTLPTVPAVSGFTAEWSIDGGSFSATPSIPITPGCHTASVAYVLTSGCGSTSAGSTGNGICAGTTVSVIIFPAAPPAPTVTAGFGLFNVTSPPAISGFAIQYSFDDGTTWGGNIPPTADNCAGYKVRTRYVTDSDCGANLAGTVGPSPCGTASPATLRIVDTSLPIISCNVTGNQYVGANRGTTYLHSGTGWNATATDLCNTPSITAVLTGVTTGMGITTLSGVNFNEGITTVTWTAIDASGNSFSYSFTVEVDPSADLSIAMTANPVTANTGQSLLYTLNVTNNGPAVALFVEIADLVPGLVSPEVTTDPVNGPWVSWSSPFDGGTMASGDISTLYIRGIVDINQCSAIVNTASVSSSTRDEIPGNNSVTLSTNVNDITPPTFVAPAGPFEFYVNNLITALYAAGNLYKAPEPDYYLFRAGNTTLDLNPAILNFNDNCTPVNQLVINWRIDFAQTPDPTSPSAWLTHNSISGTGQPSSSGTNKVFPGDGVNFATIVHTITYWLTDNNGNKSIDQTASISIKPRPRLVKINNP